MNTQQSLDIFDFSLKQSDSLDFFSQINEQPNIGVPATSNQSIFEYHNSQFDNFIAATVADQTNPFRLGGTSSADNYPWLNQQYEQSDQQENKQNIEESANDDDGYDFMNFYPQHENNNNNNLNQSTFYNNNNNNTLNPFEIDNLRNYTKPFQLGSSGDLFSPEYANEIAQQQQQQEEAQLFKLSDFDKMLPEMEFEPISEEEDEHQTEEFDQEYYLEDNNNNKKSLIEGDNCCQNTSKTISKKPRKDYDKNICRYISKQLLRSFISEEFSAIVLSRFCKNNTVLFSKVVPFVKSRINSISGHKTFKELLSIQDENDTDINELITVLRRFSKWFLRERSLRYILLGSSEDKTNYIRFKNQVMLHFIDKPEQWHANLKINPKPFKIRQCISDKVVKENKMIINNNSTASQSSSQQDQEDY